MLHRVSHQLSRLLEAPAHPCMPCSRWHLMAHPFRVVRHWPRLPREAAYAPSMDVFEAGWDGALGLLIWWEVSLLKECRN